MRDTVVTLDQRPTDGPTMWEKAFVVIAFICSTGAFLPLVLGFDYDPGAGMGILALDVLWAIIFGIAFYLLFRERRSVVVDLKGNWIFLLLLGLPFVSAVWSDHPWITLLASGALTGTAAISLYIYWCFTSKQLLSLLGLTLGLCGACSLFFVIFLPRYGIGTGDFQGQWQGIYAQKNELGRMMALGFLVFLLFFEFSRPRKYRYLALAGFMLALVYTAQSATSLVVCLSLPVVLWATKVMIVPSRHRTRRIVIVVFLSVSLLWIAAVHFEEITTALGRDEGLSGRATLWSLAVGAIQEQPFLGYGYEAFWRGGGERADEIWKQFGQFLYFSHNGILEVWLALGLLGVLGVLGSFGVLSSRALRLIRWRFTLETAWPVLFLWYLVVVNMTDDYLLNFHSLPTILFFIVVLRIPRDIWVASTGRLAGRSENYAKLCPRTLHKRYLSPGISKTIASGPRNGEGELAGTTE
jgi:exopolysaccharide production protein ExoQ